MSTRTVLRAGLVLLALVQGAVGAWQLLLPRSFFDAFPLPSHPWVALLPPYNEHLMVDVGAADVAMAVMVGVAAVSMQRTAVCTVLTGAVVFETLHFVFHATHLEPFPPADAVAQTAALAAWLALVIGMCVLGFRLPQR